MKFSLKWLEDYLGFTPDVDELAEKLTMCGLEVENINRIAPVFSKGVVVAKVTNVEKHPNADSLHICDVFNGNETLKIVCGAPNVRKGIKVPLATVGSEINGYKIKKAKLRGVESSGMLCSETELQLGFDNSGLFVLPETLEIGTPLLEFFDLEDTVFELGITPNRGDCLSVRGVAREVAAAYDTQIKERELKVFSEQSCSFTINNQSVELTPFYGGAILKNITVRPSPFIIKYRLFLSGIRSINNIVDITNYVLLDIGQPMHAFDLDKIGDSISIRNAASSEKVLALDEKDYELNDSDLVISSQDKAIAIAGVMGLENSSVDTQTKSIFLESAFFDPVSVRKTSRRLNLVSDSSYRFERGVDPENIFRSLKIASAMCEELADAEVINTELNITTDMYKRKSISLSADNCSKLLGIKLSPSDVQSILKKIDINMEDKTDRFSIPGNRNDLEREVDLIEEVARIYGYLNIPLQDELVRINTSTISRPVDIPRLVIEKMTALGFNEAVNYSFVGEKDLLTPDGFAEQKSKVEIKNPLSQDQAFMRCSLFSGLARNVFTSLSYKSENIRLFELSSVFMGNPLKDKVESLQKDHLAFIIGGKITPQYFANQYRDSDFYDIKGALTQLLKTFNVSYQLTDNYKPSLFTQAITIKSDSQFLGVAGKIKSEIARQYSIKENLYYCELDFNVLKKLINPFPVYKDFSRFPAIVEDMSFLIDENIKHEDIEKALYGYNTNLLENVRLFDVYKGKGIPTDKKSVSFSLTYRDNEKTLKTEDINKLHENIKNKLKTEFKVEFR